MPAAAAHRRIGLMGGSFDPPHAGHRRIAETALRRLRLDSLWVLVSPGNPLKSRDGLDRLPQRLAATRALMAHPRIVVSSVEAAIGTRYTVDTLAVLTRRFPHARFVWVMGADSLATLHRWRAWRRIACLVPIAVVDRPGWRLAALASPAARALHRHRLDERHAARLPGHRPPAWALLSTRLSPLSSTELRRAARAGKPGP
jgi:nicotinate-nucleotide adenylyltransferase